MKLLLSLLLCGQVVAQTIETDKMLGDSMELGLTMQYLVPTRFPNFEVPLTAFGMHLGVPVLGHTIHLQGAYGGATGISLYNIEAALRLNIPNPFFTGFFYAGGHYIHYGQSKNDFGFFGPMTGIGFYFNMAKNFYMGLGMKLYLPQRIMLTFGGSFSYLL